MKKNVTFAAAALCAFAATAQSGRCINETQALQSGLGAVSFISSKTWKVGNQTWSDAVTAAKCQKETYDGISSGEFNADCRKNEKGYGDWFSWCAVTRFQKQLCPAPWRVPTKSDFAALDKALRDEGKGAAAEKFGYGAATLTQKMSHEDKYIKLWGGAYGNRSSSDGTPSSQGSYGYYWGSTEHSSYYGYSLGFNSTDSYPNGHYGKEFGLSLRCVQ